MWHRNRVDAFADAISVLKAIRTEASKLDPNPQKIGGLCQVLIDSGCYADTGRAVNMVALIAFQRGGEFGFPVEECYMEIRRLVEVRLRGIYA